MFKLINKTLILLLIILTFCSCENVNSELDIAGTYQMCFPQYLDSVRYILNGFWTNDLYDTYGEVFFLNFDKSNSSLWLICPNKSDLFKKGFFPFYTCSEIVELIPVKNQVRILKTGMEISDTFNIEYLSENSFMFNDQDYRKLDIKFPHLK